MSVNVKIINEVGKGPGFFNIDRIIRKSLKYCKPEHLIGLEKIVIVKEFKGHQKNALGYYNQKHNRKNASIYLAFYKIYEGAPRWVFYFPILFFTSMRLVLYHEIGHHCHYTLKHGVAKPKREEFAEQYKRRTMKDSVPIALNILLRTARAIIVFVVKSKKNSG
jgi:hypothetical protein